MRIAVKVQNEDGKVQSTVIEISKKALVKDLKTEIWKKLKISESQQVLLYLGKLLEDRAALLDYKILEGGTINLFKRSKEKEDDQQKINKSAESNENDTIPIESKFYKIGSLVDILLDDTGAWYEGIISKIFIKRKDKETYKEENITFTVVSENHIVPSFQVDAKLDDIRPRSYYIYPNEDLLPGLTVLANYNLEEKKSRGLWYDFVIESVTRTEVKGRILIGKNQTSVENCLIVFKNEIMRIETVSDDTKEIKYINRKYPYFCSECRDDKKKKCKSCGCKICRGKDNHDKILLCDECDSEYHIYCLDPPLEKIPDDDWYCPECKVDDSEIVKKGEVKLTKKQASMPNKTTTSNRDWGKGMACAGRTKVCTIVPKNHFGPIPGIDVGTRWMFRMQVSESGVHRPAVSGIHGVATVGAFSLVISAGYEDDIDDGDEFLYTGSGGRDLTGNKRVNVQSCDQTLTMVNKALALNCYAEFNENGAESKDWKKGKPVRVVRNYKASKHSKYAPKEGNRYDGIYKVVKYYPEKGKSGFIVWRFLLRRDDPTPAPWEKGGQELDMIYPPLYFETEEQKKKVNEESKDKKNGKRKTQSNGIEEFLQMKKKPKISYEIPKEIDELISKDKENSKYWLECKEILKDGKPQFLSKVQEIFLCICCQDLVYNPVSLNCRHNFCKDCLKRAFKSKLFSCPCCRNELGENYQMQVNEELSRALKLLFPGYGPG